MNEIRAHHKEELFKELADRDMNEFHSIAYDSGKNKLVEMINVYTGEHKVLTFWEKIKILFF